jgi:hypothetical protein
MRRIAVIVGISAAALLGACQSEDEQRRALIESGKNACIRGFNESASRSGGMMSGVNPDRVCTCALERMAEGKSLSELREIAQQDEPNQQDLEAMGACLIREAERAGVIEKQKR